MRRLRHLLVPVVVVGAGLALSACGGDSSPETPIVVPTETTQSLDKSEFIAQADSACAEANAQITEFAAAGQGVTEADQIAQIRQGVVDQINDLGPPADDKATLDQFLTAMSAQVSAGQKIGLASQRGEDTTQFETELDTAKSEAESAASTYGFKECGSPITSSSSSSSSSSSPGTTGVAPDTSGTVTPSAPSSGSTGDSGGTSGGSTDGGSTGSGTGGSTGAPSGGIGPG
jgi:hypothetical protein